MRRWHHPLFLKIGGVVASERLLWWVWCHIYVGPQWSGGGPSLSLPPQDVAGNHPNFHLLGFRASALNSQPQEIHYEGCWLECPTPGMPNKLQVNVELVWNALKPAWTHVPGSWKLEKECFQANQALWGTTVEGPRQRAFENTAEGFAPLGLGYCPS